MVIFDPLSQNPEQCVLWSLSPLDTHKLWNAIINDFKPVSCWDCLFGDFCVFLVVCGCDSPAVQHAVWLKCGLVWCDPFARCGLWQYQWSLCLWSLMLTCLMCGFAVKLIHNVQSVLTMVGCISHQRLVLCEDSWQFLDILHMDSPPLLSCVVLYEQLFHPHRFPCGMAYVIADCRANILHFLNPPYMSLLVSSSFLFVSLLSLVWWIAEWTRPPLGWWLAPSTTNWGTGTTECLLAPSMSSRLCVSVCVCVGTTMCWTVRGLKACGLMGEVRDGVSECVCVLVGLSFTVCIALLLCLAHSTDSNSKCIDAQIICQCID